MAGCLTTAEMKRIELDYRNKLNKLDDEREALVASEYTRIGAANKKASEIKMANALRISEEAKLAVDSIIETDSENSSTDNICLLPRRRLPLCYHQIDLSK